MSEIAVGTTCMTKVGGKTVPVRVEEIRPQFSLTDTGWNPIPDAPMEYLVRRTDTGMILSKLRKAKDLQEVRS